MTMAKKEVTPQNSFELGTAAKKKLQENWQQLVAISATLKKTEEPLDQRAFENLQKVNLSLLKPFIQKLEKQYAARTVARYRNTLTFYLNEYLATQDDTLLSDNGNFVGEMYSAGVSRNEVKQAARGLQKFYVFLQQNDLITVEQLADSKETVKLSTDSMGLGMGMLKEYF